MNSPSPTPATPTSTLPPGLADAAEVYRSAFRTGLRLPPHQLVSDWAEHNRVLSSTESSERGRWRNDRTPYLVEIMDTLSPSNPAREVVFKKASQVGGTECGNNWFGFIVDQAPGPFMMVRPTSLEAKRFSKIKLAPMIEATPALRKKIHAPRSRDSSNTTLLKEFEGGVAVLAGANSAVELRSMPVKYLFPDEVDAYPLSIDEEGDPLILAERRAANFPRRKVFINTVLGEVYEDAGEGVDDHELKQRADTYRLQQIPAGVLLLTGAVDVQADRLEFKCKGYGRGEESWLVDYQVLYGDTAQDDVWQALDELLLHKYDHAGGTTIGMTAVCVDSGYRTHEVYNFCRRARHRHVLPIKGVRDHGRPILGRPRDMDVNHKGKTIKRGIKMWPIGVDTAKTTIYNRMRISEPGPKYMHFPQGLPDEYFQQLTAERLLTRHIKGHAKLEWVKDANQRNEALDLEVYCYAAALYAGITRVNWDKLEQIYNPPTPDLFNGRPANETGEDPAAAADDGGQDDTDTEPQQPAAEQSKKKKRRKRGGGFVSGWRN